MREEPVGRLKTSHHGAAMVTAAVAWWTDAQGCCSCRPQVPGPEVFQLATEDEGASPRPGALPAELVRLGLSCFQGPLAALGIEEPGDVEYISDGELAAVGLRLVQRRKLRSLTRCAGLAPVSACTPPGRRVGAAGGQGGAPRTSRPGSAAAIVA